MLYFSIYLKKILNVGIREILSYIGIIEMRNSERNNEKKKRNMIGKRKKRTKALSSYYRSAAYRKPEVREISMQEEVDANLYSYNLRMVESSRFFSLSQKQPFIRYLIRPAVYTLSYTVMYSL